MVWHGYASLVRSVTQCASLVRQVWSVVQSVGMLNDSMYGDSAPQNCTSTSPRPPNLPQSLNSLESNMGIWVAGVSGRGRWYSVGGTFMCYTVLGMLVRRTNNSTTNMRHQPYPPSNAPTVSNQYPPSYPSPYKKKTVLYSDTLILNKDSTLQSSQRHILYSNYVELKCPFARCFPAFARITYQPVRLHTSWKQERSQGITSKSPLAAPPCSSLLPPKPG